jgi:hypothetical protein
MNRVTKCNRGIIKGKIGAYGVNISISQEKKKYNFPGEGKMVFGPFVSTID